MNASLALYCAIAGAMARSRAEPVNPLRPAVTSGALRIVPVPSDPPVIRQVAAIDEGPGVELPSIVPPALGQPEMLPTAAGPPHFAEQFGDPICSVGPGSYDGITWEQQTHPLFAHPWFAHGDPNDPLRHIGIGQPLIGTSWRNRPIYFGSFVGGILMDDIQSHKIYQNDTAFVGLRIGYDFDHFWGLEMPGPSRGPIWPPAAQARRSSRQAATILPTSICCSIRWGTLVGGRICWPG